MLVMRLRVVPESSVPQNNGRAFVVDVCPLRCHACFQAFAPSGVVLVSRRLHPQVSCLFPGVCTLRCCACFQAFAQTLQQSRGFGSEFRFPDRPGAAPATTPAGQAAAPAFAPGAAAEDDDDLYS